MCESVEMCVKVCGNGLSSENEVRKFIVGFPYYKLLGWGLGMGLAVSYH